MSNQKPDLSIKRQHHLRKDVYSPTNKAMSFRIQLRGKYFNGFLFSVEVGRYVNAYSELCIWLIDSSHTGLTEKGQTGESRMATLVNNWVLSNKGRHNHRKISILWLHASKGPRSHVTALRKLRTTVLYGVFWLRIYETKFLRSRKFELRGPLSCTVRGKRIERERERLSIRNL